MALSAKRIEAARRAALETALKEVLEKFAQLIKATANPAELHDIVTADSRLNLEDLPAGVTHQVVSINFTGAEVTPDGFASTVEQVVERIIGKYSEKDNLRTLKHGRITVESGYFAVRHPNADSQMGYDAVSTWKAIITISLHDVCG